MTYVGRVLSHGEMTVGKVVCSCHTCYKLTTIEKGKLYHHSQFEILTYYNPDDEVKPDVRTECSTSHLDVEEHTDSFGTNSPPVDYYSKDDEVKSTTYEPDVGIESGRPDPDVTDSVDTDYPPLDYDSKGHEVKSTTYEPDVGTDGPTSHPDVDEHTDSVDTDSPPGHNDSRGANKPRLLSYFMLVVVIGLGNIVKVFQN